MNRKWGRGTLHTGSVPLLPDWGMRRELRKKSFLLLESVGNS
nr:DUF4113 domain-containing protein [Pseudomonas syringae]